MPVGLIINTSGSSVLAAALKSECLEFIISRLFWDELLIEGKQAIGCVNISHLFPGKGYTGNSQLNEAPGNHLAVSSHNNI